MSGFLDNDELDEMRGSKVSKRPTVAKSAVEPKKLNRTYSTIPEDERVQMNRKCSLDQELYQDFTTELYPHSLNFYDFEVFEYDWMVVIINPIILEKHVIVNDSGALKRYFKKHKDEIWVGYNSKNYDTQILKAILLDMNPKKVSDQVIIEGKKGWSISHDFSKIDIYDFDISTKIQGLKQLEGFMGNDIRETTVPFDLPRKLNPPEIRETIKYCMHDVEQTIEVFRRRKFEYEAQVDLIKTFNLDMEEISSTKAQLTAKIIGCEKQSHDDEFDIQIVDCLQIKKYRDIVRWFSNSKNYDYKNSLSTSVCGIPHTFGWGGLHGCPEEPIHRKGRIFHVDVTSYYPSIMIEYDFLTRNCKSKKKFVQIYDKRVELKKAGKKKEQAPYKIVLNGTYGICKDKYSLAFDPRQANNVCINGQLMLLDLLEHLEGYAEIIQSNTDGIILQVEDNEKAVNKMKEICQEWMDRTKMGLGFDEITEIYQKDVNNYVFRFTSGKLERKGSYVMELDDLNNDLPIVNEAIVRFLMDGKSVEDTVNECNDLKQFQKIVRISSSYLYGLYNEEKLTDKTFRVYASNDLNDGMIYKCKYEPGTLIPTPDGKTRKYNPEKFQDTPEHCFIFNEDVNGVKVTKKLDKKWYINLAKKRIEDFGISTKVSMSLF